MNDILIPVEMDEEMVERLQQVAEDNGVSVEEFIQTLVAQVLVQEQMWTIADVMKHCGSFAVTAIFLDNNNALS